MVWCHKVTELKTGWLTRRFKGQRFLWERGASHLPFELSDCSSLNVNIFWFPCSSHFFLPFLYHFLAVYSHKKPNWLIDNDNNHYCSPGLTHFDLILSQKAWRGKESSKSDTFPGHATVRSAAASLNVGQRTPGGPPQDPWGSTANWEID